MTPENGEPTPSFRGKAHVIMLLLAPIWAGTLFKQCQTTRSYVAAAVSVICSLFNFSASASLHNFFYGSSMAFWARRIDHAAIFCMIAGSCTPIPVCLFSVKTAAIFLVTQWSATAVGLACILLGSMSTWPSLARSSLYICIGLLPVFFSLECCNVLTNYEVANLLGLAVCYIVGGIVYGLRRPNPWPKHFGFHEIFHGCCCAAGVCTFCLNKSVLARCTS